MMLARSVGRPRASLEERTLSWDEVQQALRSAFFSGEEPDTGQSGAERLSPVAAAHRILTNSFGLIPFGLYRKEGEERVAVDTPELIRVLKIRPNDYMSPFMLARLRGGVEPAGARRPGGPAHLPAQRLLRHPKGPGDGAILV